jgi:hypothetical protein
MDLTIRSFNFCIGSLGTLRLSDPILLGPLANKPTTAVATSSTSVNSSSEANLSVSIKSVESRGNIVDLLDGIKENFNFIERVRSQTLDQKKATTAATIILKRTSPPVTAVSPIALKRSGSSSELHEDEMIIWYSEPAKIIRSHYQMCAIINETSEEFDKENNPVVNPANLARGFKYRVEADTDETVAARVKICLTSAGWEIIKIASMVVEVYPQIQIEEY